MARALVVADTDLPSANRLDPVVARADVIVAADGGADRAFARGIRVDWVVGDLDGISRAALQRIPKNRVVQDGDRDHTDLEKALAFLRRRRIREVTITGAVGGRLDHTVGTLAVMAAWHDRLALSLLDEDFSTTIVHRSTTFRAPVGTMVSLLAPAGAVGVSTRGLRFPLKDRNLPFSALGIHNEVSRNPVRVKVRSGLLFLMRSHEARPHA